MKTILYWIQWVFQVNWIKLIRGYIYRFLTGKMTIYEVAPGLYQSSKFSSKDFDTLVNLKVQAIIDLEGIQDQLPPTVTQYRYWPIKDEPKLPNLDELKETVSWGYAKWKLGGMILTHCNAGCNRSGLVNALILVRDGMSGPDAVKLIRSKVPAGLSNMVFAEYVKGL